MSEFIVLLVVTGLALGAVFMLGYSAVSSVGRRLGLALPAPRALPRDCVVPRRRIAHYLAKRVPKEERRVVWGGIEVPLSHLAPHSVLSGSPGSGKSMCMLMYERSALAPDGDLVAHAVHFDPKQNAVPELVGMGISLDQIIILNPFDARSRPVHLAADFTTEAQARQLAALLVPEDKGSSQPFFTTAVRDLFAQVVVALQRTKPSAWTLADALQALRNVESLREHLGGSEGGRNALAAYLSEQKLESHIMATVRSKTQVFDTVAALWANSPNPPITLSEWVSSREPSVLVFGHDPVHDAVVGPINRALFLRLSQIVLGRPEASVNAPIWIFLDEARLFRRLEGLQELLFAGRSFQVRVAVAFQDFEGLSAVWGPKEAGELIGQCGNVATFRLWNPATMELASRFFGDRIEWVRGESSSTDSRGQRSTSESWSQQVRRLFLPAFFRTLPPPSPATGIPGVFTTPALPVFSDPIPPSIVSQFLPPSDPEVSGYVSRPSEEQSLKGVSSAPPSTREGMRRGFRTMDGHDLINPE